MSWNYSGRPGSSDKDEVRFLIGDTCESNQLVSDEEIAWALTEQTLPRLAGALVLRGVIAQLSRSVTWRVGDISENASDAVKAYKELVDQLDPGGETIRGFAGLQIGGISKAEKEELNADTDAVQPFFYRGMNDIPGGPGDDSVSDSEVCGD